MCFTDTRFVLRDVSVFRNVQTYSGTNTSFCSTGTEGSFPRGKATGAGGCRLNNDLLNPGNPFCTCLKKEDSLLKYKSWSLPSQGSPSSLRHGPFLPHKLTTRLHLGYLPSTACSSSQTRPFPLPRSFRLAQAILSQTFTSINTWAISSQLFRLANYLKGSH